jgi:hypothetical protein
MVILVAAIWVGFLALTAIIARTLAVKWAQHRGWSALTMPMVYHVTFITAYLVIVAVTWLS